MVLIGESRNGLINARQSTYNSHINAIKNRLKAMGLRTYTQEQIRQQVAQAEIDAYFKNDADAALNASKKLAANYILRGVIETQATRNLMVNVNQVNINMAFTLTGANGKLISQTSASNASYAGADTSGMALTLINESADEVVATLYSDYCRRAGTPVSLPTRPRSSRPSCRGSIMKHTIPLKHAATWPCWHWPHWQHGAGSADFGNPSPTAGSSTSNKANAAADAAAYREVDYVNKAKKGPALVVIPGEIKSAHATFTQKFSANNIADFGELELSNANFKVLERANLGNLLQEVSLAYNLGDANAARKTMQMGKLKTTKWIVKFDILKAEQIAENKKGFDGGAIGG
jgi:hypothetical protein